MFSYSTFLGFFSLFLFFFKVQRSGAVTCPGCVDLDELSFDKTIKRFPYSLIKFDVAFPFGEKHEVFSAFSKAAHKATDDLLIGTVGIKDYGDNENKELGARFNVDEKKFPDIILFRGSDKDLIRYPSHLDVTLNNLKQFVSKNTDLYIGEDGCLKDCHNLVKNYANQEDSKQLELIKQGEELLKKLEKPEHQTSAKFYLTFMRKINEKGYDFVEEETKRLQRLKAGKVTQEKKVELQQKLSILDGFRVGRLTKTDKVKEDL